MTNPQNKTARIGLNGWRWMLDFVLISNAKLDGTVVGCRVRRTCWRQAGCRLSYVDRLRCRSQAPSSPTSRTSRSVLLQPSSIFQIKYSIFLHYMNARYILTVTTLHI